VAELSFRA